MANRSPDTSSYPSNTSTARNPLKSDALVAEANDEPVRDISDALPLARSNSLCALATAIISSEEILMSRRLCNPTTEELKSDSKLELDLCNKTLTIDADL